MFSFLSPWERPAVGLPEDHHGRTTSKPLRSLLSPVRNSSGSSHLLLPCSLCRPQGFLGHWQWVRTAKAATRTCGQPRGTDRTSLRHSICGQALLSSSSVTGPQSLTLSLMHSPGIPPTQERRHSAGSPYQPDRPHHRESVWGHKDPEVGNTEEPPNGEGPQLDFSQMHS